LPIPGIELYTFHHPVLLTMEGAREYWKKRETATAAESSSALRFRPVVPGAVLPKQALHREDAEAQAQYVSPSEM